MVTRVFVESQELHPVIHVLARFPLAIESKQMIGMSSLRLSNSGPHKRHAPDHLKYLTGVVATPKELCLSSVLESHPMKRNSRVSQHLLQECNGGSLPFLLARMYVLIELYTYELPLLHV